MNKKSSEISQRVDRTVVRKIKKGEARSDFEYWQSQPYEKRLAALEAIRQAYNQWRYGGDPPFQRVYKIVKRSQLGDKDEAP